MTNMPFFTREGDTFHPTEVANGPWDPKSLHGRVIVGLLGFVIEERHSGPEFVPTRLTVDMFRLPTIDKPIEVTTRLVRDGLRIRMVEAEFFLGRRRHGARLMPIVAADAKPRRQCLVAAELGRAEAG